jgi:hypothetical protein
MIQHAIVVVADVHKQKTMRSPSEKNRQYEARIRSFEPTQTLNQIRRKTPNPELLSQNVYA